MWDFAYIIFSQANNPTEIEKEVASTLCGDTVWGRTIQPILQLVSDLFSLYTNTSCHGWKQNFSYWQRDFAFRLYFKVTLSCLMYKCKCSVLVILSKFKQEIQLYTQLSSIGCQL